MASEIVIVQDYGLLYAGYQGAEVAKNLFYFIREDDGTISKSASPVIIPSIGINYSYEVWLRFRCDVAPDTQCYNFKVWYASGMPVTGFTLTVNSDIISTYAQPVDIESSQGTRIDFTTKDAVGNSIDVDGILTEIGDYTSWLVFQLEIEPDAETGNQAVEFYVQFDEI